jgi:hypothetical protein
MRFSLFFRWLGSNGLYNGNKGNENQGLTKMVYGFELFLCARRLIECQKICDIVHLDEENPYL